MAQELELKLSLPTHLHQAFKDLDLLAGGQEDQQSLFNAYFDTPDLQLQQAKIALRIRQKGDRFIQTLKTRGTSDGGLHDRNEWEWELAEAKLDINKIKAVIPETSVQWEQLDTLFETDFVRSAWILETLNSSIEIALDLGEARKGDNKDPISEIELELKEGEASELFTIAEIIAETLPVRISRISKAERGYRLMQGAPMLAAEELTSVSSCLANLQTLLEWHDFYAAKPTANEALQRIASVLTQLIALLPKPLTLELSPVLQQVVDELNTGEEPSTEALWAQPFCLALLKLSGYLFLNPSD